MEIVQNLWIALFLPVFSAFLMLVPNSFVSQPKRRLILTLSLFTCGICLVTALFSAGHLIKNPNDFIISNFTIFNAGALKIHFGIFLDNLSAFMLVLLYTTAFCAEVFSYWYLKNKEGFDKYFILLNVFIFTAAGMILSTNLIQTCLFLELLGFIACLFTGYCFRKPEVKTPFFRAFTINKIGDIALFAALLSFVYFALQQDSVNYPLLCLDDVNSWGFLAYVQLGALAYTGLCLLIALAAFIKSAQFPFQSWFIDATHAPSPVCALIFGATTATGGVYLLLRLYPILILSPLTLKITAVLGGFTALICGIFAYLQNDIKKMMTFGAASGLGIVFASLGAGAYSGAVFQLGMYILGITLMFFAVGIISNKTYAKNIKFLGGLRGFLPTIAFCWILGSLSLSGALFSGFYAKETIFSHLYDSGQFRLLTLIAIGFLVNVLYLARGYFLIFEGHYKGSYDFAQDENKPMDGVNGFMSLPLYVIAVLTAFAGGFIAPDFQRYIYISRQKFYMIEHPETEILLFILAVLIIYFAWLFFGIRKIKLNRVRNQNALLNKVYAKFFVPSYKFLHKVFAYQFYINKIYEFIYAIAFKLPAKAVNTLDKYVINGASEAGAQLARFTSYLSLRSQNGKINTYIFATFGFITLVLFCVVTVCIKEISKYGG